MNYRPFIDTLRQLRKGRSEDELSQKLNEVIGQVLETGKSGELTLTLKVSRVKGMASNMVQITDAIKAKAPSKDRDPSLFFADDDNNLHRNDPNQGDWVGRETEVPKSEGNQNVG